MQAHLGVQGIVSESDYTESDEENKDDSTGVVLSEEIIYELKKLQSRLQLVRQTSNENKTKLIFFIVPVNAVIKHMNKQNFCEYSKDIITSLYIFKLQYRHVNGWNYGMYLNVNGYCPRRTIRSFIEQLLSFMTSSVQITMIQVRPTKGRKMSVVEYVQSLYGSHHNLIFSYQQHSDAISAISKSQLTNHTTVQKLVSQTKDETNDILEIMLSAPAFYKQSILWQVLEMKRSEFVEFMQDNSIHDLQQQIVKDAYNCALQRMESGASLINGESLLHHTIQRSIVNKLATEHMFKRLQNLLSQYFGDTFVHPHPLSKLICSHVSDVGVIDGMLFNQKFMFSLLLVSRWFARVCLQKTEHVSNNRANLIMYGQSGAGKTLIASAISQHVPTYRYLQTGKFQNPDILCSALMYFEEMDVSQLVSNQYKALFDIKSAVKMDFKNAHPQNATEGVAAIISTNDSVFSAIRSQLIGRPWRSTNRGQQITQTNEHSVTAALRRLYIVPLHFGEFSKTHGYKQHQLPDPQGENAKLVYDICQKYNGRFESEDNLLPRLFNLIVALAVHFQDSQCTLSISPKLRGYIQAVEQSFKQTLFYKFMLDQGEKVTETLEKIEQAMDEKEISDTEYLKRCYEGALRIEIKAGKFIKTLCKRVNDESISGFSLLMKDTKYPWPNKIYHFKENQKFMQHAQAIANEAEEQKVDLMNAQVRLMIQSDECVLYKEVSAREDIFGDIVLDETDKESAFSLSCQITDMVIDRPTFQEDLLDSCMGKRDNRPREQDEEDDRAIYELSKRMRKR